MKTSSLRQVIVALTIAVSAATVHGAWFASTDAHVAAPVITISTWDYYEKSWTSATHDLANYTVDNPLTVRHSEDTIVAISGAAVTLPVGLNADELDSNDLATLQIPEIPGAIQYLHLLVSKPANMVGSWPVIGSGPVDPDDTHLAALDVDGSVGVHTVPVEGGGTFTWDIGRWSKGDIFLGLNNHTYKVLDRNGNFKRFVASADYDEGEPDEVYNVTTGCATNWKTGEVYATNFGDYRPAVNILSRHPSEDYSGDLSPYSSPSRRISTRIDRTDDAATVYANPYTTINYGIDTSPESVVFDADMNMYVGHSFGNFRQPPAAWQGDPDKIFEYDDEWTEYTIAVDGLPLEGWSWADGWGWVVDETGVRMLLAPAGTVNPAAFTGKTYGVEVSPRLSYNADGTLRTATANLFYPAVAGLDGWDPNAQLPESFLSDPSTGAALVRPGTGDALVPSRWSLGKRLHKYIVQDGAYESTPAARDEFWTFSGRQGTDWIDLDVTGEVMYYTSEDSFIHRYRVKPGANGEAVGQLPDVGVGLEVNGQPAFGKLALAVNTTQAMSGGELGDYRFHGLRILPPGDGTGGFLVAVENGLGVHRFTEDGRWVQRYYAHVDKDGNAQTGENGREHLVSNWYTLEVDPGGRSFWASAHDSGWVVQFDIASGRVLNLIEAVEFAPLNTPGKPEGRRVEGICIMWEYTAPQEICFTPDGDPQGLDDDGDGYVDENCVAIEICSVVSPGDDDGDLLGDQYDTDCGEEAPPIARDDSYSTNQDVPLSLPLPGILRTGSPAVEDYDPDNRDSNPINDDTLTVVAIGQGGTPSGAVPVGGFATTTTSQGGSVTVYADGRIDYQPATGFHGLDTFVYQVSDGLTRTEGAPVAPEVDDIATVTILVRPLVVDDEFTMPDRLPMTITAGGPESLLSDDSTNLTLVALGKTSNGALANRLNSGYTLTGLTTNNGGVVAISPNGTFTYTPATGFTGTDRFYYIGNDGHSDSYNVAEVRIIVPAPSLGVTAQPVCIADVPYVTFTIAANYAPANNAPVTMTWFDSQNTVISTVVVPWVNASAPLVTQVMWPGMVLNGSTPVDWPGWILSGGLWTEGSDGFENTRPTSTVRFSVNPQADVVVAYPPATPNCATAPPANRPPVAVDDTSSTTEDTPVTISVLPNDSDPENGPLTVSLPTPATTQGGTVTVNPNGTVHYVPAQNFCGVDTFEYTITDAAGLTDTATVTVTVSCVRDVPTIAATGGTFQYDRNTHPGTCTVTGVLGESLPGVLSYTPGGSSVPVNVGTYTATCTFGGNADYDPMTATATVTITPRPATVTAGNGTKVFGTADPALTATTHTGFLGGDLSQLSFSSARATGEAVGTYATTATATGAPLGNYTVEYFPGTFTITPAVAVCTIPAAPAVALVRTQSTFDGTLRGSVQLMDAVSVTLNSSAVITGDLMMRGLPSITNNGTPTYTLADGTGAATPTSHQFMFNSGATLGRLVRRTDPVALPVVAPPAAPTGSRSVTMNQPTDNPGDFATLRDLTLNSNVGPVTVPAGNYGTFMANTNTSFVIGVVGATTPSVYSFQNLTLNSGSALTVVGPVVVTVGNSMSFNGPVGALANPEWFTLRTLSDVTLNSGVQFHGYVEAPNGRVTINGSARLLGGLAAHALTINSGGVLELVQGAATPCSYDLVVKIDDKVKVYGDPDPALTYQIISGGPVPDGLLTGAITRVAGEPVGDYTIGQGTLAVGGDYTLEVIPGTLTVIPRPATVTAGSGSKVVGTPDPALTAIATTGFLTPDLPAITLSHARATGETVGLYGVTATATGDVLTNYSVTYFPGEFEITKAPSVTTPTGGIYTYDGTAKPQTCTVTGVNGTVLTGGVLSYSPGGTTPPTAVGTYAVTCEFPGDATHTESSGTATVRIDPKAAVVTAGTGTKVYGTAVDPALTAVTTSGFLGSDASTLTLSQQRVSGETVGGYDTTATATGAVLSNYTVTYVPGAFTITPAPLTVTAADTTRPYLSANPAVTRTITGFVNGETESVLSGTTTCATSTPQSADIGTYADVNTCSETLSSPNYTISYVPGDLTVTGLVLTVTASSIEKFYGDSNPTVTYDITGFQGGDTAATVVNGTTTCSISGGTTAGTYTGAATCTPTLTATNYTFVYVPGDLIVNKVPLVVTAATTTKVYGDPNPAVIRTITGFVNGDDAGDLGGSSVCSTSSSAGPNVGTFDDANTCTQNLTSPNYTFSYVPGDFSITPRPLTVRANDKSMTIGSPLPALDGTLTGAVVNGDVINVTYASTNPGTVAGVFPNVIVPSVTAGGTTLLTNYNITIIRGTLTVVAAACSGNDGYTTYSQGGWGSKPSGNNPGALLAAHFGTVYPNGVVIGGTYTLTFTSALAIQNFLPAGGTSKPLTASAVNPTSSAAGNIGAQLLALRLATDFSAAGVTKRGLGSLVTLSGPLAGQTVNQILDLANTVVGGQSSALPSGLSISELASILESLNLNYHEGTENEGLLSCGGTPPCSPTELSFTGSSSVSGTAGNIRTFSAGGVSVKASAFSRVKGTNGAWATAYLGVWNEGLGVTDTSESGSNDTHKTDNNGRLNYVLFEFSQPVIVSRAYLNSISGDSDATIWVGTRVNPYTNHTTLSDAVLASLGTAETSNGGGSARWAEFNDDAVTGNVIVIAADVAGSNDTFKVSKLQLECGAVAPEPEPVAPTIAATGGTFVYSGESRTGTCSVAGAEGISLPGTLSYGPGSSAPSQVGTYTVTCSFAGDASYTSATATATLTITPAPLTVQANNTTKVQGTPNPALDGALTGVVGGDAITAGYTTTATTASPAGSYPIVPVLSDPAGRLANYTVSAVNGTLTVMAPVCTVSNIVVLDETSSSNGPDGNVRTFTQNGVTVKVAAFSRLKSSNTWAEAFVGAFGSAGLGVTDSNESGNGTTHTLDNNGRNNYLVFVFSEPVVVTRAYLGYVSNDSDAQFWVGTLSDAYASMPMFNDAILASLGSPETSSGGSSTRWASFNGDDVSGNVLVVAAKTNESNDYFKVAKLDFDSCVTAPPPPPPPSGSPVCEGGVTKLVLKYIGSGAPNGVVRGQRSSPGTGPILDAQVSGYWQKLYTFAIEDLGGSFESVSAGRLANNFTVFIGSTEVADVHTSCSVPIYPGMKVGNLFEIVEVWTKGGGKMTN